MLSFECFAFSSTFQVSLATGDSCAFSQKFLGREDDIWKGSLQYLGACSPSI